ncbi:MAG: hypothetical protein IID32_12845 [Planctomycetes bacterium]|nr:hypothetical protein [Planctomycetota bacterium]
MNSIIWRNVILLASVITFYTMCITIIARGENKNSIYGRRWLCIVMPLVVCLSALFLRPLLLGNFYATLYFPLPILLLWMGLACWFIFQKPPQTKKTILLWLSGICLVDAYFLSLLEYCWISFIATGCCFITVIGYLRIKGT